MTSTKQRIVNQSREEASLGGADDHESVVPRCPFDGGFDVAGLDAEVNVAEAVFVGPLGQEGPSLRLVVGDV